MVSSDQLSSSSGVVIFKDNKLNNWSSIWQGTGWIFPLTCALCLIP